MNNAFEGLGFGPADILLPADADMTRWSVVACDQYTSEPEYWQQVDELVADAPSALRLILPENHLESGHVEEDIAAINAAMNRYLSEGIFKEYPDALIYVERTQRNGAVRRGLVGQVDLEDYDYTPGAPSLIRATEGTVLSRIPPRAAVRRNAPLELPHIMLLIDDRRKEIIESLSAQTAGMEQVYSFDLMQGGGHVAGWLLSDAQKTAVADGLRELAELAGFEERYQVTDKPVLLFAMGDGNHSLATAKAIYEERKASPEGPGLSRYALAEVVNLHDDALEFEPIHRVVFGVDAEAALNSLLAAYPGAHFGEGEGHTIRYACEGASGCVTIPNPTAQLEVGTLQSWLDGYLAQTGAKVDYVHGDDVTTELGSRPGNLAFLLPPMGKDMLFRTVICDGVLPRKTFSMGEAHDKRFYLEARRIR